jgi:hypothetical protein
MLTLKSAKKSDLFITRVFPTGWKKGDAFLQLPLNFICTKSALNNAIIEKFGSLIDCQIQGKNFCINVLNKEWY